MFSTTTGGVLHNSSTQTEDAEPIRATSRPTHTQSEPTVEQTKEVAHVQRRGQGAIGELPPRSQIQSETELPGHRGGGQSLDEQRRAFHFSPSQELAKSLQETHPASDDERYDTCYQKEGSHR